MTGQWPPPQQPGQPDQWPGTPQYPSGPPQYPGQPQGQYPMPPVQQEKRPVPADVLTAFQLWFVVAALGVVYLVAALLFVHSDRASFVDQLMDEFAKQQIDPLPTRAEVDQLLTLGLVATGVILTLVLGGLTILFAFKMRKGKNWARMLLTMAGVFTVFSALPTVFGAGGSGTAALLMGGAGILQAVAAIGAIVLMHRKESNAYFLNLPPAPPAR
ncbi:hypothetical protein GS503_07855 [Rhodococcus hoagii]|nr:hypothetical protein [Prescottella equi]